MCDCTVCEYGRHGGVCWVFFVCVYMYKPINTIDVLPVRVNGWPQIGLSHSAWYNHLSSPVSSLRYTLRKAYTTHTSKQTCFSCWKISVKSQKRAQSPERERENNQNATLVDLRCQGVRPLQGQKGRLQGHFVCVSVNCEYVFAPPHTHLLSVGHTVLPLLHLVAHQHT